MNAVWMIRNIFGDVPMLDRVNHNFSPNNWRKKRTNRDTDPKLVILEFLAPSFLRHEAEEFLTHREQIRDKFHQLFESDVRFRESILHNPYQKEHILYRFETWNSALDSCLAGGVANDDSTI